MRHPHLQFISEPLKQAIDVDSSPFMLLDTDFCVPIFPLFSRHHISRIMPGNCLKSVADAEDWNIESEDCGVNCWSIFLVYTVRTTREYNSCCYGVNLKNYKMDEVRQTFWLPMKVKNLGRATQRSASAPFLKIPN